MPDSQDAESHSAPSTAAHATTRAATRAMVVFCLAAVLFVACSAAEAEQDGVRAHLEGRITVSTEVDSTADYSGFRVLIAQGRGRSVDTLAYAVTDQDGRFSTTVRAPERGIYPLLVWGRSGRQRLVTLDYVAADGDSAALNLEFPLSRRAVRIQSSENAALLAYRNTMALHRQMLVERLQEANYRETAMQQSIRQTSSILWGLRDTYGGTYAAQLAAVESLGLLEGWNDSLVVVRARQVVPENPRYVEAARIGRRAAARTAGQGAAVQLVNDFQSRAASDAQRASLQAVLVGAYADSLQKDQALAAADQLAEQYPETQWADWADRASYELQNLLPGMKAPDFRMLAMDGDSLSLDRLEGQMVVLEFFRPGDDLFEQQIPTRNALYEATRTDSIAWVSVSLESDPVLNQAFFDGRTLPGRKAIAPEGVDDPIVETYNVAASPTRYLIDGEGRIVDKYVGSAFLSLQDELRRRLGAQGAPPNGRADAPEASPNGR